MFLMSNLFGNPFFIGITLVVVVVAAFLVRSVTLSSLVHMTPNVVCMLLAMTRIAVHRNRNSTLFRL